MADATDPQSVARANAQSLIEAIAAAETSERKALIEREIIRKRGKFDLTVVDQHGHNVLFYAENYDCSYLAVGRLQAIQSKSNAEQLLMEISAAEISGRKALIEREINSKGDRFDLTVVDQHGHNVYFYSENYECSSSTRSLLRLLQERTIAAQQISRGSSSLLPGFLTSFNMSFSDSSSFQFTLLDGDSMTQIIKKGSSITTSNMRY